VEGTFEYLDVDGETDVAGGSESGRGHARIRMRSEDGAARGMAMRVANGGRRKARFPLPSAGVPKEGHSGATAPFPS
jgi:hypothetical protein